MKRRLWQWFGLALVTAMFFGTMIPTAHARIDRGRIGSTAMSVRSVETTVTYGWGKHKANLGVVGTHMLASGQVWDLALDGYGYVYLADASTGQVRKVNQAGRIVKTYVVPKATCVYVDRSGYIYVGSGNSSFSSAFTKTGKVYKLNQAGSVVRTWSFGAVQVRDVTSDRSGNVFITYFTQEADLSVGYSHIYRITPSNTGRLFGDTSFPKSVVCDAAGNVWVADVYTDATVIEKLDAAGNFKGGFVIKNVSGATYSEPFQITMDSLGYLYAVVAGYDSSYQWVPGSITLQKYRQSGTMVLSGRAASPAEYEDGVAVDSLGYIYLARSTQ